MVFSNTSLCSSKNDEPFTIYYLERVPYYSTHMDGTVQGVIADRVRLVFEKAGIPIRWEQLPAKRHMLYLENNRGKFGTIGWYKTKERVEFAKYSEHIYQNKTRIALARKDNKKIVSNLPLAEILSGRNLTLLIKSGYSYGTFIDEAIAKFNPDRKEITTDSIGMIKLIHGRRYDYFFTSEEEAEALIQSAGYRKEEFQFIRIKDAPPGLKRYILYSRNVDDKLIQAVDKAIIEYLN